MQELSLTQEWDKTFPKSDKVNHRKVTFHNRFWINKVGKHNDNKELMIIPDAVHTDLYDNLEVIPFDKIEEFIRANI